MTQPLDHTRLAALAKALLALADAEGADHRIHPGKLPGDHFEKAAGCTAAEVAQGFKQLEIHFVNDGTILFDRKRLEKAAHG